MKICFHSFIWCTPAQYCFKESRLHFIYLTGVKHDTWSTLVSHPASDLYSQLLPCFVVLLCVCVLRAGERITRLDWSEKTELKNTREWKQDEKLKERGTFWGGNRGRENNRRYDKQGGFLASSVSHLMIYKVRYCLESDKTNAPNNKLTLV